MNRSWLAIVVLIACALSPPAFASPRRLTIKEAESLALVAIKTVSPHADRLPGFELDRQKSRSSRRFEQFSAWSDAQPEGYTIDAVAVDMRTGDVEEVRHDVKNLLTGRVVPGRRDG